MWIRTCLATVLIAALLSPAPAVACSSGDVWRNFARKLDAGSTVVVRLQNGQRFQATLIEARADALLLQPRTRRPVSVQPVSYDAIRSLERQDNKGPNVAKAVGIGAGVGAGTFLAILAIFAATLD